ncbi:hypothetical protein FRC12_015934 [Ceratobasidium sp. 428]|nr:hypothetical protein FRC12_015934 [Ceratobasidium sp. 428]
MTEIFAFDSDSQIHDLNNNTVLDIQNELISVTNVTKSCPGLDLRGILHVVDGFGMLRFQLALTGEWFPVWLYTRLEDAMIARLDFMKLKSKRSPNISSLPANEATAMLESSAQTSLLQENILDSVQRVIDGLAPDSHPVRDPPVHRCMEN